MTLKRVFLVTSFISSSTNSYASDWECVIWVEGWPLFKVWQTCTQEHTTFSSWWSDSTWKGIYSCFCCQKSPFRGHMITPEAGRTTQRNRPPQVWSLLLNERAATYAAFLSLFFLTLAMLFNSVGIFNHFGLCRAHTTDTNIWRQRND